MLEERKTLKDKNIDSIGEYIIDSIIGFGGSSIIYMCHSNRGAGRYSIIKELYPSNLQIERNDMGLLIVPEESISVWELYVENALAEVTKTFEIGSDGQNNDDFVFKVENYFRLNNTVYTVLETSSGDIFTKIIEYCDNLSEDNADVVFVLDYILKIIDTLDSIHRKGYLHLDISPDNIYISQGTNTLRLIDYNSSIKENYVQANRGLFSFKVGYSAPELEKRTNIKIGVGKYTDTYSVCAILYRMIRGKVLNSKIVAFKSWDIRDTKFCRKLSQKAVSMLEDVFDRGFSMYEKRRFQTCAELMKAIETIKNYCQKPVLKSVILSPVSEFVGREAEVEDIIRVLDAFNYVFVCGMAGIGKSEVVKKYASVKRKEYESIYFCSYVDSLKRVVADMRFSTTDERYTNV